MRSLELVAEQRDHLLRENQRLLMERKEHGHRLAWQLKEINFS